MRKMKRVSTPLEEASVNLTPLIDVVFVVLIMFIVLAPLLEVEKVELAVGGSNLQSATSLEEQSLIIHVFSDNSVAFNKEALSLDKLPARLARAKKQFPKKSVHLFHDKNASFGTYQSVKSAVENAGFSQMDVILTPHA